MALAGLAMESTVRGPSWRFLDLGRRLERAYLLLALLEATVTRALPGGVAEPVYETVLAACESLVAYRRRYRSDLALDALCDLLLADDTNPRALAFQLDRLSEDIAALPTRRPASSTRRRSPRPNTSSSRRRGGWLCRWRRAPPRPSSRT